MIQFKFYEISDILKVANVILPLPIKKNYSYLVPVQMEKDIEVGQRVIVNFGAKRFFTGIVHSLSENSEVTNLKPISEILDIEPLITKKILMFWQELSEYFFCYLGDIYQASIPSIMRLESQTAIHIKENTAAHADLSEKESFILSIIEKNRSIRITDLSKHCNFKPLSAIKTLVEKNLIYLNEDVNDRYKEKSVEVIYPNFDIKDEKKVDDIFSSTKRAKNQTLFLEKFLSICFDNISDDTHQKSMGIPKAELLKYCSNAILKSLITKGILRTEKQVISRILFNNKNQNPNALTVPQQEAMSAIEQVFTEKRTCLLQGVTSSGKTEIHIHLIHKFLAKGKDVLYLVPEIGLTSQVVERLKSIFGSKLMVYHSKISEYQRFEIVKKLTDGENYIIIGVRSALFLPFKNLGLIVIDEEHDSSYLQMTMSPRYNTKIAAAFLANVFSANILLSSATPSIESYSMAKASKIGLVCLNQRYGDVQMPVIELIDLKEMYHKKRMVGHFSLNLIEKITETLNRKQQVIIFQNRRGYWLNSECKECGYVPKCHRCDVSLTYYNALDALKCNYCGYLEKNKIEICPKCGSRTISHKGFGTEQVETEIKKLFPQAKYGRVDFDTTRKKMSFEKIIKDFEAQSIDIIVGTQMIAKGLDFSNVGMVAVLNADNLTNFNNFRAYENCFQTLVQISGRAGRKTQGEVIIQAYSPDNEIIKSVVENDYNRFFHNQKQERIAFKYPPYCRLITITLKHRNNEKVKKAAKYFADELRKNPLFELLGPESPPISKINNLYIRSILLKIDNAHSYKKTNPIILKHIENLANIQEFKYVNVILEVD